MAVPPSVPGGNLPRSKDSVLCSFLLLLFLPVPRLRFPLILSNGFRLYCILYHIRAPLARGESKKVGRGRFFWAAYPAAQVPGRACPVGRLPTLPPLYLPGGLAFLSPAYPAFSLLPCPLSPYPPSPAGKGVTKVIFMQGAPPLASPAFNRLRHLQTFSNMNPTGACPVGRLPTLPLWCPAGGLPSLPSAYPAFSLLPCPLSPSPFPNGEGEIYGYFMQGAPPLASLGLSPSGAGSRDEPLAQRGLARLVACRPCRRGARRGG